MNENIRHKVGDRVIALTDPFNEFSQPRKKGQIYTVKAVAYCPKCGAQKVNIGHASIYKMIECGCGCVTETNGLRWTNSFHFAPIDEATLQSAIEQENYELAAILRDYMVEIE